MNREWKTDAKYGLTLSGKEWRIDIIMRPPYCDRGNYIAHLDVWGDLRRDIDGQDAWPRYYFDLERAKLECEAFVTKREWT